VLLMAAPDSIRKTVMVQELVGVSDEAERLGKVETRVPANAAVVAWARDSILFSSCNEDTASELRAFGDIAGKHVLCITAGGGRVLNLLVGRPKVIWAVDLNPAQNYLLELKVAGLRALDHAGYLRFLGVRECSERLATYAGLRERLTGDAQRFFDEHPELIRDGVLLQGRLERYLRRVSKFLQLMRPLGAKRLFSFEDLDEQRKFLRVLETPVFRALAETACRRSVLRVFSGDPGFYKYVPEEIALHQVIYDGMLDHFRYHLARNNPLFSLVFFGRFIHEHALPIYLNAKTFQRVKDALEGVRLVTLTSTVNHALAEAGPGAFDVFSLSDVSSYLDDAAHAQLFEDVFKAARPGAKLSSRSNIHHRPLSAEHERRIVRDRALERELAVSDHSCVHKFLIGEIL
jgi:S-adenosylmethionine-diacylglycerol 3-amino-3-carboxypropyl transferase